MYFHDLARLCTIFIISSSALLDISPDTLCTVSGVFNSCPTALPVSYLMLFYCIVCVIHQDFQ